MTKLSFEYNEKSGYPAEHVASYRGLTIKAVQDECASNPWQDSDGFAPLLWTSGESWQDDAAAEVESVLGSTRYFSDYALGRKWAAICKALDCDAAEIDGEVKAERREYGGRLADYRRDKLEAILSEARPSRGHWGGAIDYLDKLEALWQLAGSAALAFQRNGYSQSDSVLGLLVATPEWRAKMGIKAGADMASDLERQANTFGAYAFGDVYGFVIESPEGESLDSIWGYYGDNFEESGLAESAREIADSILASAAKRRCGRLAELVRNRVPLEARPAILAEAGRLESVF